MAKKPDRSLDVWITETGAVYTEVPFTVVTDWVQQGRLLADDRVRLAGKQTWHPIARVPALYPYLPQEEALETLSPAEALEPVDLGWHWQQPGDSEDEDVDMIPLIDISLVLLIFFMMTATVSSGVFSAIAIPETKYRAEVLAADQFWVGIEKDGERTLYSLGKDNQELTPPTAESAPVLAALTEQVRAAQGDVKVRLRADRALSVDVVTAMMRQLRELTEHLNRERQPQARFTLILLGEVSEKEQ